MVEQTNKRTNSLEQIGLRVLKNIENKSKTFSEKEEILAFYSSDLMIDKMRQIIQELKDFKDVSKAENLENLLKKSQEDTLRVLRDKTELFVDGQNIIALGQNKFTVNTQQLALTLLNRNNELFYHTTFLLLISFFFPILKFIYRFVNRIYIFYKTFVPFLNK